MNTSCIRYGYVTNTLSYVLNTLLIRSRITERVSDVFRRMSCVWVTYAERTASVPLAYSQRIIHTSAYVANFVHAQKFWQSPTYANVCRRMSAYPQRVYNVSPAYSTYASVFADFFHTSAYAGSYVVVWQQLYTAFNKAISQMCMSFLTHAGSYFLL